MALLRRLLAAALIAGVLSGLVLGLLQLAFVVTYIHQAEAFEVHAETGGELEWEPKEGFERSAYTVLSSVLAGIGFALLLNAAMLLHGNVDAKRGLLWGLAGFAVFSLAPALGLPPELPGVDSAHLSARQLWWIGTVLATAGGLACVALLRPIWVKLVGAALLVLPHAIGAPSKGVIGTSPVEHLEMPFIVASLAVALIFWLVLGAASGRLHRRLHLTDEPPVSLAPSA